MRGLALVLLAATALAQQAPDFYLKPNDRVVFYGDSITEQRLYTTFVETYAVTRYPDRNLTFVHSGWGGDRVTGGGGGPIDHRLQRDVFSYNPSVVTVMLGMNDGGYRAFDQQVFETYRKGYEQILDTISGKRAIGGRAFGAHRITAIIPSPYDDVTRKPTFEGGYNAVLVRYGQALRDMASKYNNQVFVADMNAPVVTNLQKANQLDPVQAAKLIPDRVHPGAGGHLLMALALLKEWKAPAVVSTVEIDAAARRATVQENTRVTGIPREGDISWTQLDNALPFPLDRSDPMVNLAIRSSDVVDALDLQMLRVKGLAPGSYSLLIDGTSVGTFKADELAAGVNLATLPTPMLFQAQRVHAMTMQKVGIQHSWWRGVQVPLGTQWSEEAQAAYDAQWKLLDRLGKEQRAAAQPVSHKFALVKQ